jgi:hypothetical protein
LELNADSSSYLVIAEFKVGDDSHFELIDGITVGPTGAMSLKYREQYDGFKPGRFGINDLKSLRVIVIE